MYMCTRACEGVSVCCVPSRTSSGRALRLGTASTGRSSPPKITEARRVVPAFMLWQCETTRSSMSSCGRSQWPLPRVLPRSSRLTTWTGSTNRTCARARGSACIRRSSTSSSTEEIPAQSLGAWTWTRRRTFATGTAIVLRALRSRAGATASMSHRSAA